MCNLDLSIDINREQAALPEYEASYRRRLERLEKEQAAKQHACSIARLARLANAATSIPMPGKGIGTAAVSQGPVLALANMRADGLPTGSARGHSSIAVPGFLTEMICVGGRRVNWSFSVVLGENMR